MEVVMLLTVKMFKTLLGQILPFSKFSNFTLFNSHPDATT